MPVHGEGGYLGDSLKSTWDSTLSSLTYTNFAGTEVTRNDTWGSCEVSCCAWAVFKFSSYLLQYTGKPSTANGWRSCCITERARSSR